MRIRKSKNGITALAVAGTYVVLIGRDMAADDIVGQRCTDRALRRLCFSGR